MYKIQYFTTGNGMCASDLDNQRQTENINLQQVSSLSDMKKFYLPFSGTHKGDYAIVSMQNGDRFYIDKSEHYKIMEVLIVSASNVLQRPLYGGVERSGMHYTNC